MTDFFSTYNDSLDEELNTAAILVKKAVTNGYPDGKPIPLWVEHKTTGAACEYVNYDRKGKQTGRCETAAACHAGAKGPYIHIFFNRHNLDSKEWRMPFINWVINESPMSRVFLSKNPEAVAKWGAIMDATVYEGLAFTAAIATRSLHEHAHQATLWWPLVQAGVPPTLAYMIAMCHACTSGTVSQNMVSHGGIDPYYWDADAAKRWLGVKELYKDGKVRMANGTFFDTATVSDEVRNAFRMPAPETTSRFGAKVDSIDKDSWVAWQADHWVDNLLKLGIKADSLGTFQAAPVKKTIHEPEEDL